MQHLISFLHLIWKKFVPVLVGLLITSPCFLLVHLSQSNVILDGLLTLVFILVITLLAIGFVLMIAETIRDWWRESAPRKANDEW